MSRGRDNKSPTELLADNALILVSIFMLLASIVAFAVGHKDEAEYAIQVAIWAILMAIY